ANYRCSLSARGRLDCGAFQSRSADAAEGGQGKTHPGAEGGRRPARTGAAGGGEARPPFKIRRSASSKHFAKGRRPPMSNANQPIDNWEWNKSFSFKVPRLQTYLDWTSLGAFKQCPRYYYYNILCGYNLSGVQIDLEF